MGKDDDIKVTISAGGKTVETTPKKMRQLANLLKRKSPEEIRRMLRRR